jgi:hypothetical protein
MLRVAVEREDAMRSRPVTHAVVRAAAVTLALSAVGCSHLHWPWHHSPPPPPVPVHELDVGGAAADAFPQYWKRNTLLLDLSAASGSGSLTLKPAAGNTWPMRLAFRVTPGAIGMLEVHAAQRISLPVTPGSAKPIDLELAPGIYTSATAQMTVSWGPGSAP